MSDKTLDPVNTPIVTIKDKHGVARLGLHTNKQWHEDPKHLLFSLARYKFVAKMLGGKENVLEIGCGDAFCSRLVRQEVKRLVAVDIDPLFIEDVKDRSDPNWPIEAAVHDALQGHVPGTFEAVYSLDVLEHIPESREDVFLSNACRSLSPDGVLIIGIPSLESQAHSKGKDITGHVNCKSGPQLKTLLEKYFKNVFSFSMNDEIVHTGHAKMAHYLICVCCGKRA